MAAGGDRLSGLSDDLLRRVLYFVPAKEGAFTSVLSRRWSPLWRSCGAVNLEVRVDRKDVETDKSFYARCDAAVSAAHQALDAAEADGDNLLRKLTIRLEASSRNKIRDFPYRKQDLFALALSHPAARRVEELRIAAVDSVDGKPMFFGRSKYEAGWCGSEIYPLLLASLPSATLRVLELTNCGSLNPAAGALFPQLMYLRLRHCVVTLQEIQLIIDAAPLLAVIHLDSVLLEGKEPSPRSRFLRCPTATTLVLDKCCLNEEGTVEIYAPMLRRFRYRVVVRHISLSPPPPHLAQAELTLTEHGSVRRRDPGATCQRFWETVHGFSHAKEMKLRVRHLEEIAITDETGQDKLLSTFRNLERLELQGVYAPTDVEEAAAVIANLLRYCPVLCDLRINLITSHEDTNKQCQYGIDFLERKYRSQFDESVQRFKRRRSQPTVAGDDEDDDASYDVVSDLPGLSGHSFECLRRCLRIVCLQFRREMTDCFGTKLIKFFAEHAKVLEEMCIDDGNERLHEHMNQKIEKWISNKSNRRRIDPTSTRKIKVSSLTR